MVDFSKYKLAFDDEFNSFSMFSGANGTWKTSYYYGDRTLSTNGERQLYVDPSYKGLGLNPFSVNGGVLTISAQKVSSAVKPQVKYLDYTSGMLSSEQSYSMQYGYYEIRAQLPAGKGLWPAFWMLPINGASPPELDIMEVLGNASSKLYTTVHSSASGTHVMSSHASQVANTAAGFHTYGVDWGPTEITWYFDGQEVFKAATPADMHKPMYLIANLAVGGYWPGNPDGETRFPAQLKIDYIRAYSALPDHTPVLMPTNWVAIDPNTAFSHLDASGIVRTWDYKHVMGPNETKLQLTGDWSRFAVGNDRSNYIAGSDAPYNEINGGLGNDVLKGNGGIDVFIIKNGDGNDVILDFSHQPGNSDKVELHGFHFTNFADVVPFLKQVGSDTLLRLDDDQALLLKNVSIADLHADQFVFLDSIVPRATANSPLASNHIWGTGNWDTMTGTAGADTMLGYSGNDAIRGNGGDDVIYGGWGTDVMNGGAGHDRFVFTSTGSIGIGALRDKITDWGQGGDFIDLSQIDADVNHAGNQSFNWVGGSAFTGKAGELRGLSYGGGTVIEGDVNGDHAADFQIWLSSQTLPKWSDFVL